MDKPFVHPHAEKVMAKFIASLPHAVIVSGPPGVGTATVAHFIAQAVGSPRLTVSPKKRAPNGTQYIEDHDNGSIIIDDIRTLYDTTRGMAMSPQVFVIDFANRPMTLQAQNAFLKLLEEPRPNIHFVLATHHPEQLLPTVVSRCQRLILPPITAPQTVAMLDALAINDPVLRTRMRFIADGLPAELHRLAHDPDYYQRRVATVQDAKAMLEGTLYDKLVIIHRYKDQRALAIQLINDLIHQLRHTTRKTATPQVIGSINRLIAAYDAIQANGNVQLHLVRAVVE